jgi:hypothetical protein
MLGKIAARVADGTDSTPMASEMSSPTPENFSEEIISSISNVRYEGSQSVQLIIYEGAG